jgi:tetratricopeptide (TPR) repeat protein
MNRALIVAATIPLILGLASAPTLAQDESASPPARSKAERISDRALASLVAWKVAPAENLLSKNEKNLATSPEYETALGYLRAIQGNSDEATTLLQEAAEANPSDPAPQYYLGEVQHWRQRPEAAATSWRAAKKRAKALVKENAADARAQYYFGAAQVRLEQFGAARTALEAAREGEFDPALVQYQLGLSYVIEKRWQDAVNTFDALAEIDPTFAHLYFYRGLAWDKLDRKDKMLNDWSSFVGLAPGAPEAAIAQTMLAAASR